MCNSQTINYIVIVNGAILANLVLPEMRRDWKFVTILDSVAKHFKESGMVVTQPNNNFGDRKLFF